MKKKIMNYIYTIFITTLLASIILIDVLLIISILITAANNKMTITDLLSETGGRSKGATYTKGAGLISIMVIQVPVVYFLINEIQKR